MTEHLAGLIEPVIDADAVTFWHAVGEGRLVVPTCKACGTAFFPPLPVCPRCQSEAIEHRDAIGTATLYSWVVMHRALDPAFAAAVPYVVVAAELTEGARLFGRMIGVDPSDPNALWANMALRVVFVTIDGRPMWAFEPDIAP